MSEITLDGNFYRNPQTHRQRITRKQLRQLLLEGRTVIACGNLFDIKNKHVGVGVYEIWLEQRRYS